MSDTVGESSIIESSKLTRKERELLDLFQANPGRCFSRTYLLHRIWGYRDDTRTRTVDVHVSRLRKKLEKRRDVSIHTVVRQGYVLEFLPNGLMSSQTRFSADETSNVVVADPILAN